jgi:hypothetical protein
MKVEILLYFCRSEAPNERKAGTGAAPPTLYNIILHEDFIYWNTNTAGKPNSNFYGKKFFLNLLLGKILFYTVILYAIENS